MACEEARERLSPFVDDELDPVASQQIADHVRSCAECAAALAGMTSLRERLRDDLEYHRAPDLLRARILSSTRRAAPAPERARPPAWGWLAAVAAVVLAVSGTWLMAIQTAGSDAVAHEVVSGHIRSLMPGHLMDVVSTDQHTVKPWFNGRTDYSPPVVDYAAEGYPLIGGRLDYLQNRPVSALVYQRRKHIINLFVSPTSDARESLSSARSERGFQVIHGTHGGMSFWIVSDLNSGELSAFARLLTPAGSSS